MASNEGKVYLPQQRVRPGRGRAGYKGKNVVVTATASPRAARVEAEAEEEKTSKKSGKKS